MKKGFVPALGTPLSETGELKRESFAKEIDDQINAGATAVLAMGSMGIEACIRDTVYPDVAKAAVEAAKGRVPVFVGAMDTSIARVKERIASLEDTDVAGFVFTAPFYSPASPDQMMAFFRGVAASTRHQILLYDLPVVSQVKITYPMVKELLKTVDNFGGIKTPDLKMLRKLCLDPEVPDSFVKMYSDLDTFDVAYKWGIPNCLDGMLSCTPKNTSAMFKALDRGDDATAAKCLDNIVDLRDQFVANDLWRSYTACMNLLGCEGSFSPDFAKPVDPAVTERMKELLIGIGELEDVK